MSDGGPQVVMVFRTPCATPGCTGTSAALCDWPLGGAKAGQTCSRSMCDGCRTRARPGRDYCRAHAELGKSLVPVAEVGARSFRALHLVREHVLSLPPDRRLVSGRAAGVDIVAEITARQRSMHVSTFPVRVRSGAAPEVFRRVAMERNTLVAEEAVDGTAWVCAEARGTWDTVEKMRALGKPVDVREEPPEAEHSLLLYTAPHPRTRQAKRGYHGPCMLDVTRGSGGDVGDPFAPSAELLAEVKRRMAQDRDAAFGWYAPRYVEEMRRSWVAKRLAWNALLARNVVILACYCPARETCHRGLLADLLVKGGGKVGRRVVDGGEVPC